MCHPRNIIPIFAAACAAVAVKVRLAEVGLKGRGQAFGGKDTEWQRERRRRLAQGDEGEHGSGGVKPSTLRVRGEMAGR